ncbi:MAG: PKD domain-containing protein [Bacteroidia bacterium]
MRSIITLALALFIFTITANAQKKKSFSDDFESYSNNTWLARTSSTWTTWSGNPTTGGDDVRVTNSDSYSGTKSIYFSPGPGDEDVVLPFGGVHDDGQLIYTSMWHIPKGKSAYFNFQGASSVGSTWAVEVTFQTTGSLGFSNNNGSMFTTTYPQDKWFEVKIYANISKNEWHVIIDNEYKGKFRNSINKASHLDLFPIDANSSFWVDDVAFNYAPPLPDNAGVEELISPLKPLCGKNDFKVKISNNGINAIDSVKVNWSLNGVLQTPVTIKNKIDSFNTTSASTLEVTLDSTYNLGRGNHLLKVWTSDPNGVADTINLDDTLEIRLYAEVKGGDIDYGSFFQGKKGRGTEAWPDTVCTGDTINYIVNPPAGLSYSDLGTDWFIRKVSFQSNGTAPLDSQSFKSNGTSSFRVQYVADTSEAKDTFKLGITVSLGNGCDTTLERYFYVNEQPHVEFTANDACLGKLTRFVNTSKAGGANKYLWNFGDNTTARFIGTSKRYTTTGKFSVTLRATAPSGCRATTSQDINVYDIPIPKFLVGDACDSSSIDFLDSSSIVNGSIAKYFWEFGDGDTSNVQNPSHLYDQVGTYTVKLSVTSDFGCTDKLTQDVTVYPAPDAAIALTNGCEPDTISFKNNSIYKGSDALSYEWDFGNGNTSNIENPMYQYGTAGTYLVKMIVTSSNGCTDSSNGSIEIYAVPTADFSVANACLGDTTIFTNNCSGTITEYNWFLRQGNRSSKENPKVLYSEEGNLSVQLIITAEGGCTDTVSKNVEVFEKPNAAFTLKNACEGSEVIFNNQSSTGSGSLTHSWSFGDGNSSTDLSPAHTFTTEGTYSIELTVTTENNCSDSKTENIEIFPLPNAEFSFEHKGWGQYDFAPDDANLVSYEWNFGDGNTSTDLAPYHEYDAEGDYDVTLKTTDNNSCVSENTSNVSVSTGINDKSVENRFNVFPNPFTQGLNITYEIEKESLVIAQVYNLNGQLIETLVNQKQIKGKHQVQFNTHDQSGIYMVKLVIDNMVYHQQIVKSK